jgi:hypothetical protein
MTEVGVRSGDIVDRRSVTFRGEASDVVAPEMYEDETYPLLSGIDPYSDAVFNSLQMPRLIKELERRSEAMDSGPSRQRSDECWAWRESVSMHLARSIWCS